MDKYSGWIVVVLAMLAGALVGAFLLAWWQQKRQLGKRHMPRQWPLHVRPVVNSRELLIWDWLLRTFLGHQIMVKLPLTRFTLPQVQQEGAHWFELLNGVYCTFTLCTTDGRVIGCIDVPGPAGLSLSNQTLKHTLLSQFNIRYWVIDPEHLPSVMEIRAAFLGDQALKKQELAHIIQQASLTANWSTRVRAHKGKHQSRQPPQADTPEPDHADAPSLYDSRLSTGWRQDSFVDSLDSRTRAEN